MTTSPYSDIRWIQRFENYRRALVRLTSAITVIDNLGSVDGEMDYLLKEGLIQRFEYTHELAWKVMKDYEEYQGYTEVRGSRDAMRLALQTGLIDSSDWMDTIPARNLTSHNYDEDKADEVYHDIVTRFYPLFKAFEEKMTSLLQKEINWINDHHE